MQEKFAIKFFMDKKAFDIEQQLFSLPSIRSALPAPAFLANVDGAVRSPQGYVFPPHTVAPAAEPLEKWMSSQHYSDFVTVFQVFTKQFCLPTSSQQ